MHNKGLCAKKWTNHGLNLKVKAMFFSKTKKNMPRKFLVKAASVKPRKRHFWLLKHDFFMLTSHNIIYKHVLI